MNTTTAVRGELNLKWLGDRLAAQMEAREPDCADQAMTLPASWYSDPQRYEAELDVLFRKSPIFACWSGDIRNAGDYRTLSIAGINIVVIRGDDGQVRAFRNACTHRGVRIAPDDRGCASRFTCPYHAWTYDSKGKLLAFPFKQGFPGVSAETHSLRPVVVAEKYGFVFVRAEGDAPIDVDEHLGGLAPELAAFGLEAGEPIPGGEAVAQAHWKLVVEGFLEGYHFPILHTDTLASYVWPNTQTVDFVGPHLRQAYGNYALKEWAATGEGDPPLGPVVGLSYVLFPNTVLVCLGNGCWTAYNILPGEKMGETHATDNRMFLRSEPWTEENRSAGAERLEFTWKDVILSEDRVVLESIWSSIKGGTAPELTIGRNEAAIQHFHQHWNGAIPGPRPAA
jgi:phenylpropionate dioxygenase-like ring-hydroxylating dioxygenase large terminal subunit